MEQKSEQKSWLAKPDSNLVEKLPPWMRLSPDQVLGVAGLVLALGIWLAIGFWPASSTNVTIEAGAPSPVMLRAPRSIEFESALLTEEARLQAESHPDTIVYITDRNLPIRQRVELNNLLSTIQRIREDTALSTTEQLAALTSLPSAAVAISDTLARDILTLSDSEWQNVRQRTLNLYDQALTENNFELDEQTLDQWLERSLPFLASMLPGEQRDIATFLVSSYLQPNRTLDTAATEARKQEAREGVEPVVVQVQAGETIVREGQIVTPQIIERLEATGGLPRLLGWTDITAAALLSVVLSALYLVYLRFTEATLVAETRTTWVLVLSIVLVVAAMRFLIPQWSETAYVFPLAMLPLVLTIVFNSNVGLVTAFVLAFTAGFIDQNSFVLTLTFLTGSIAGVLATRITNRLLLTLLIPMVSITVVTATVVIAFWLTATLELDVRDLIPIVFYSTINGLLSAILALGLVNVIGRLAGVITPLQLLELAHPAQPLLRRLMREAPGTYSHSVSVGNLAEAAAEAIGGDALLLRVAAYYHDIGKMIRPYFFTDNQMGRENVHNELDPHTSAAIIIDHVREGIKMGESAGLPQTIIDFIATHHGTSTVAHFYQIAMQEEDSVDIKDFRYPGPRPSTREQGIMMLADSVEATVRSKAQHGQIKAATPHNGNAGTRKNGNGNAQTLDAIVGSIIEDRVRSGQLENTPLTQHDLQLIRQAFVNTLQGLYHPRVEYSPQLVRTTP